MALIKQADLDAARVQIQEAIKIAESLKEEWNGISLDRIIDPLNEALCNLCNE